MAITIVSGASTPGANTKTADLVSGTYQFVGAGTVTLAAKATAAGINATVLVGGVPLINDQPVIYYAATAGTLSLTDNIVVSQYVKGGKVEMFFRNTTATAGTAVDYNLMFNPGK